MILDINSVSGLKKELSDKFGIYLHMHDACGAQSFSFDEPVDEDVRLFVSNYASEHGGNTKFSADSRSFIIK